MRSNTPNRKGRLVQRAPLAGQRPCLDVRAAAQPGPGGARRTGRQRGHVQAVTQGAAQIMVHQGKGAVVGFMGITKLLAIFSINEIPF